MTTDELLKDCIQRIQYITDTYHLGVGKTTLQKGKDLVSTYQTEFEDEE